MHRLQVVVAMAVGWLLWTSAPARASTAYGDLNNFDVFNDSGQECHGFEIELDDVHSTDITYTYDWNHYGAPTITEDNSVPGHPKVFVRYAAKYGTSGFTAYTAMPATPPSPTDGHMCTDPSVNFGCEHFGVGYYGTPTAVRYNWLVEDTLAPGTLKLGPPVNVATPNWTYYPPAPAQPVAQVQAVVLAPPPPPAPIYEFGDAIWVKSIVTTSHNNARVELRDLVSDDPDSVADTNWRNGEPDEVEVEWQILQTEFNNPGGANNELAGAAEDLPNGDEVVTRRYEFYKYAGPLDGETNEAMCDNYPQVADTNDPKYKAECDPASVTVLGDYIGAQMAGFNVEAVLGLIDHVQDGDLSQPYTARTVVVGGNTPYVATVSAGALPPDMSLDEATGVLSGTPSAPGLFSFTVTATDADLVQVSKAYTLHVTAAGDLCAGVICTAIDTCHEAGVCDPDTGVCSDPVAADGTLCDDADACTQSDTCQAGTCTGDSPVVCNASDQCHDVGVCDPDTGVCSDPPAPDGTACDDTDACSQSDTCQSGLCTGANPIVCNASDQCHEVGVCDPGTGICSDPVAPDGTACDEGDGCPADTCAAGACQAASCPSIDVVALPIRPLTIKIPSGESTVGDTVSVSVRNADVVDRTIALTVGDGDCPTGTAGAITPDHLLVPAGKSSSAGLALTIRGSDFDTFNLKAPTRCTLTVTAEADVAGGSNDPTSSNNVVPVEINVLDKNDTPATSTHESLVQSVKPVRLSIKAGAANGVKTLKAKVTNADISPTPEKPGDAIALSADSSCAGLTLGPPICDRETSGGTVTVKGGGTKTCKVEATATAASISTANHLAPQRCIVTLTASGPSSPETAPLDASNNITEVVVDVDDGND